MKKALINTSEGKLKQVVPTSVSFTVEAPLMWVDCADDVTVTTHEWNGTALVPRTITLVPKRNRILKSTIRARLRAAGLETAADALLAAQSESVQKDWNDYIVVFSDNTTMQALLASIGADVSAILAPDPSVETVFGSA